MEDLNVEIWEEARGKPTPRISLYREADAEDR
jgi:hypothetical protein